MNLYIIDSKESFNWYNANKLANQINGYIYHYAIPDFDIESYPIPRKSLSLFNIKNFVDFSCNWYIDKNTDVTLYDRISWGPIIGCSLLQLAPYVFKEIQFLKNLNFSKIFVSENELSYFKIIAKELFKENFFYYKPSSHENFLIQSLYIRTKLPSPVSDKRIYFLELIQSLFIKNKKMTLAVNEGTLIEYFKKIEKIKLLNSRIFSKSLYCFPPTKNEVKIPVWLLNPSFYLEHFQNYSKKNDVRFENEYLEILSRVLCIHLNEILPQILEWISYYEKIFNKFSIDEFYIPGERVEFYAIALVLAKKYDVKCTYIHDGFNPINQLFYFSDKIKGTSLFNKCILFKNDNTDFIQKKNLVPDDIIIENYPHPMIKNELIRDSNPKDIDILIFLPVSVEYNHICYPDYVAFLYSELAKCLIKNGINTAIKYKNRRMKQYFDIWFKDIKELKEYCEEPPSHCIKNSKILVTGASTAIMEAKYLGVECFIYEPIENGFDVDVYANSSVKEFKIFKDMNPLVYEIQNYINNN